MPVLSQIGSDEFQGLGITAPVSKTRIGFDEFIQLIANAIKTQIGFDEFVYWSDFNGYDTGQTNGGYGGQNWWR